MPNGGGGEQEAHHAVVVGAGYEAHVVMQQRRDDAGGAIGRSGHHPTAGGVFLVDGQGIEVDPVEHVEVVAQVGLGARAELAVEPGGAALHLEPAGQPAFGAAAGAHAVLHDLPDLQQPRAGLRFRAPGRFVGQHQLADRQTVGIAQRQQLAGAVEGVGQRSLVLDDAVAAGRLLVDDEAAAYRVVLAAAQLQPGGVEGAEDHAVGMEVQRLADHRQVFLLDETDRLFSQQTQAAAVADRRQPFRDAGGIDLLRLFAFEAEDHRLVAAMTLAGGAERAVQLDAHALGRIQQAVPLQARGEPPGCAHGADSV